MSYPRMNKEDYGVIPTKIIDDNQYNTVLEFIVMAGLKIDDVVARYKYPLIKAEEKKKLGDQITFMMRRYDQLCNMLDEYKLIGGNK